MNHQLIAETWCRPSIPNQPTNCLVSAHSSIPNRNSSKRIHNLNTAVTTEDPSFWPCVPCTHVHTHGLCTVPCTCYATAACYFTQSILQLPTSSLQSSLARFVNHLHTCSADAPVFATPPPPWAAFIHGPSSVTSLPLLATCPSLSTPLCPPPQKRKLSTSSRPTVSHPAMPVARPPLAISPSTQRLQGCLPFLPITGQTRNRAAVIRYRSISHDPCTFFFFLCSFSRPSLGLCQTSSTYTGTTHGTCTAMHSAGWLDG